MACNHRYECDACGMETFRTYDRGADKKQWVKCDSCGQRAYWSPIPPQMTPDIGTLRLSTLKPLEWDKRNPRKVDVVEGRAALREHIKKYDGKYGTKLEIPK